MPDGIPYITPPFNPAASSGSNNLNPLALLDQLLNTQQDIVPQQKPNVLSTVLQSIAQGIGVATSPNPGQALLGQLNQQQDRNFLMQQQAQQRLDRNNQLKQQVLLQTMQDQLAEQRQIRAEGRQEQASIRKDKREEDAAVREFNRQMAGKERLQNIDFEQNKKLAQLKFDFEDKQLTSNQNFQRSMAELQAKDRRVAEIADTAIKLISFGSDSESAFAIARKVMNDEKLTAAEAKQLDKGFKAMQAAQRAASRGGGSGGGTGINQKEAFKLFQEFAKTPYVELEDGTIVEASAVPNDVTGVKQGVKRYLSPQEGAQYAAQTVLPAMAAFMNPAAPKQQTVVGSQQAVASSTFDATIQQLRKNGVPDDEIRKNLAEYAKNHPEDLEIVQGAAIRNNLTGAKKFTPKSGQPRVGSPTENSPLGSAVKGIQNLLKGGAPKDTTPQFTGK